MKDLVREEYRKTGNYMAYLNYELTPDTWNLLVNKQIYMKFERLFIERQLMEKKRREEELLRQIEQIEADTAKFKRDRENLETRDMKVEIEKEIEE